MASRSVLRSLPRALTDPNNPIDVNTIKAKQASGQQLTPQETMYLATQSPSTANPSGDSQSGNHPIYTSSRSANDLGYQLPSTFSNLPTYQQSNSSTYNSQVPSQAGGHSNYAGAGSGAAQQQNQDIANASDPMYNQQDRGSDPTWKNLQSARDAANAAPNDPGYQYRQYPTLNLPSAPISTITPKDFSTQAGSMAAKAYAPSYAALDTGRGNVKTNYTLADKVVAGLYDNLANGNNAKQAASTAQYAAASKAGTADAAATQATIGKGYQSAQSNEAATLKSLGITAAAPGALQATSNAQAQQQGAAAQNSANQAANLKSQATNQNSFQANQGSADASQGLADRSNLLTTRNTTLGQYDAQQQAVAGQQGQQALTIGQGLTSQDLSSQQTNANLKQQQYSNTVQNLMNQYNTGVANMQYQDTQNATQYNRAVAANSANYARGQQNWQNNFDVAGQQGNLGVDLINANTGAVKGAWDVSPQNPANYYRPTPVNPNSSADAQVIQKYYPQYSANPTNVQGMLDTIKGVFNTPNGPQKGDSPLAIKNASQNAYRATHPNATQDELALVGSMALDWTNGLGSQSNTGSQP